MNDEINADAAGPLKGSLWMERMELDELRDKIAIAALQGVLASDVEATQEIFAECSYDMAEAMLKERAKRLEKDNEA